MKKIFSWCISILQRKLLLFTVIALLLIATGSVLLTINVEKNILSFTDIFRRYIGALLIGLLSGIYLSIIQNHLSKLMKNNLIDKAAVLTWSTWLKCSFFCGLFLWGLGAASFLLLITKFVFELPFINRAFVCDFYIRFLIDGFVFGNILYVVILIMMIIHRIWEKKTHEV